MVRQPAGKLTLRRLQSKAQARAVGWHGATDWSLSDWMVALTGEVGEAANIVKKMNRLRDGMKQRKRKDRGLTMEKLREMLKGEIADIQSYLVLFAEKAGIDTADATVDKFNEVSDELGSDVYL